MNIPILELIGLLCALNNNVTYFDSFGVEYIPKEIKKITNSSTVTTNIYRIQAYDSVMCGYFGMDLLIQTLLIFFPQIIF